MPAWNPFVKAISGSAVPGSRLRVTTNDILCSGARECARNCARSTITPEPLDNSQARLENPTNTGFNS